MELGGGDEVLLLRTKFLSQLVWRETLQTLQTTFKVFLVGLVSSGSGIRRAPDFIEFTNKRVQVRCSCLGQ